MYISKSASSTKYLLNRQKYRKSYVLVHIALLFSNVAFNNFLLLIDYNNTNYPKQTIVLSDILHLLKLKLSSIFRYRKAFYDLKTDIYTFLFVLFICVIVYCILMIVWLDSIYTHATFNKCGLYKKKQWNEENYTKIHC